MATYDKVCKVCGREFVATHKRSTCCSDACKRIEKSRQSKKWYTEHKKVSAPRLCPICGKEKQLGQTTQSIARLPVRGKQRGGRQKNRAGKSQVRTGLFVGNASGQQGLRDTAHGRGA